LERNSKERWLQIKTVYERTNKQVSIRVTTIFSMWPRGFKKGITSTLQNVNKLELIFTVVVSITDNNDKFHLIKAVKLTKLSLL
jgi:hypothetical protein